MKQQILTIRENVPVTSCVYRMRLEGADLEAQNPGGFVNIRLDGLFLRRPISVYDSEPGSLTILYKVVGKGTEQMAAMKPGVTLSANFASELMSVSKALMMSEVRISLMLRPL